MSTTKNSKTTAPLARYADVEASPVIKAYCDWIEQETGRRPDAWSVYVGSQLRGTFQKTPANQKRIADEAKARAAREADKAKARAEREAQAAKKAAEVKEDKPKESKPAPKAPVKAPAKPAPRRRPATKQAQPTTTDAV